MTLFDRRAVLTAGVALASGAAAAEPSRVVRVPVTLRRNQPLVALELNGRGPFTFLLDTGADGFGITAAAARRAGLPSGGRADISGVSGGVVSVATWFARDVRIGGALDVGLATFAEFSGGGVDGYMAGNALIAQPAALSLAEGAVSLFLKGRPDLAGYARLPAAFEVRRGAGVATRAALDPHLVVSATLNGRPLRLAIDSGDDGALTLLPDASGAFWETTPSLDLTVVGATGWSKGRMVRAGPLQVAGVSIPEVVVALTDPAARHIDDLFDGLIGVDLLRQFDLVIDAPAAAVWLRRSAAFGQAFRYNRSGVDVAPARDGLAVTGVAAGSPAAAAGLARGDVLTPAAAMTRGAFLWSLQDAPGVVVEMDATRDGRTRPVSLVLRELI